jgi:GNAT superfamily N-acetyltransferase
VAPSDVEVRPAQRADLRRLQEIEVAAGELFRPLGMAVVADDDPFSLEELERYADAGHAWVAAPAEVPALGYLVLDVVDGAAHVEQVSVDPAAARQGIGRALLRHVAGWAAGEGFRAVTLTTYLEVPWNGPYYERLGYRRLAPEEETPGLRALRDHERSHGLDAWPRGCLRLDLPRGTGT